MNKIKVAVLFGGASSEHEVSLMSVTSILRNLDSSVYEVVPVGVRKNGAWFLYEGDIGLIETGAWEQEPLIPVTLCPGISNAMLAYEPGGMCRMVPIDVVFPVLHGKNGEDGTVQGMLDLSGIPYVGCGVLGSAVCMDKVIANCVMESCGITRCAWDFMERHQLPEFDAIEARVAQKLGYPIFVKPANAGSSVGISKAADKASLQESVALALQHDDRVVFERFVAGHEVECAVRGNDEVTSTLPGEILASKEFYDYEDKYIAGTSTTAIPAHLPPEKLREVQSIAVKAYRALCCRGLARVDFFVEYDTGAVLLNEINTLPGFTSISMYPKLMIDAGETYAELLDSLIRLALRRAEAHHA